MKPTREFGKARRSFASLMDCVEWVNEHHAQATIFRSVIDKATSARKRDRIPKYLYRGERFRYPDTLPGVERLRRDEALSEEVKAEIERTVLACNDYFVERLGGSYKSMGMKYQNIGFNTVGFLQHYGFPTEYIDFTSDMTVAAFFASKGCIGSKGLICVTPSDILTIYQGQTSLGAIVDLGDAEIGKRAHRQSAYEVLLNNEKDMKADLYRTLGARWYEFLLTDKDMKVLGSRSDLLDTSDDILATQACGVVHEYVIDHGKLSDVAARWLADRIEPLEAVVRPVRLEDGKTGCLLASQSEVEEAGLARPKEEIREHLYRVWSSKYPDEVPQGRIPPGMKVVNLVSVRRNY